MANKDTVVKIQFREDNTVEWLRRMADELEELKMPNAPMLLMFDGEDAVHSVINNMTDRTLFLGALRILENRVLNHNLEFVDGYPEVEPEG